MKHSIDNRKKEVSTKLWYSTIGRLETCWQFFFKRRARACAHAHIIFSAESKRDALSQDAMILLTEVMYFIVPVDYTVGNRINEGRQKALNGIFSTRNLIKHINALQGLETVAVSFLLNYKSTIGVHVCGFGRLSEAVGTAQQVLLRPKIDYIYQISALQHKKWQSQHFCYCAVHSGVIPSKSAGMGKKMI